ncbi:hypothetical protein CFP65_5119 [Kitasatospora sp. MMS16-BH015]|uniref:DUF3515 domain-containing protein n=1 Tax=Kitasatospora sp. MMS16-BH015 TaxID=2018025 RepID=UPI000CA1AE86|nr:DUF3515 domain-containing protein [Kitasatospora sp. MMS16-BH015]AUG79830.1 hypothetical protein CFP65_5119 [Kitasatospora sp. MMS16-BH015]
MTALRALRAMPAPVRWATPALALLGCAGLLVGGWTGPEQLAPPTPGPSVAQYCEALDKALPNELLGHKRSDPEPASPYTAAWGSSPRTVLRCGIIRPDYLDNDWSARSPEVNDVQFGMGEDGHGGYFFVTSQVKAYVEIHVPKGAYPNYADPLSSLTDAIKATIPAGIPSVSAGR